MLLGGRGGRGVPPGPGSEGCVCVRGGGGDLQTLGRPAGLGNGWSGRGAPGAVPRRRGVLVWHSGGGLWARKRVWKSRVSVRVRCGSAGFPDTGAFLNPDALLRNF